MTVEWRRPLSIDQVLWELETARRRVLDAIAALSDEELRRVLAEEWPLRTVHESEHASWISAWRDKHGV